MRFLLTMLIASPLLIGYVLLRGSTLDGPSVVLGGSAGVLLSSAFIEWAARRKPRQSASR
jgi:preprotein translocase subunit SecG